MTAPASGPDEAPAAQEPAGGRDHGPTLGTVLWLLTLAWGAGIAGAPLTDNSFLTHLATGRLILDRRAVPSTDPYTFTAAGTDWTVQSWLASLAYAGAEQLGGVIGLRFLVLVVFLAAAALLWRLSRACASLVPRFAIVFGSLYVVTSLWGERPYMTGVLGLGIVWLALDRQVPPWTMVPLYWLWANTHGSFPLGVGLAVLVLLGRKLDGEPLDHERRVVGWSIAGVLASAVGPLGPRALLFPLTALSRADVLSEIVEWQPASFTSLDQRLFLVLVAATILGLVRRPSWALALPTVVFVLAAVVAQRNIVMAVMILVPVLSATVAPFGELTVDRRPDLIRAYVAVGVVALLAGVATTVASPFGGLDGYPARPLAIVERVGVGEEPFAAQDIVGNLLTVLDGEDAAVFVDDRVDMLPEAVVRDGLVLLRGQPGWDEVLERYDLDVVVWDRSRPLGAVLAADPRWRLVFSDTQWFVACRRGVACDAFDQLSR